MKVELERAVAIQGMQENWILAIMPKCGNSAPGPKKMNFVGNFWFLWKGLWISFLTSPQPPQTLSLSQVMQENFILAYYAQRWKFSSRLPKMEFFKKVSFFEKVSRFRFQRALTTPDINFKSSYARKRNFGLLCPNMKIRPQAPKNGIFHFSEKVFRFRF